MEDPVIVRDSADTFDTIEVASALPVLYDAISPRGRKHIHLVGKDAEITVRENVYCYDLKAPCYVESVCVESMLSLQKELSFICSDGDREFPVQANALGHRGGGKHRYEYRIGKLISGFRLKAADACPVAANVPLVSKLQVFGASYAELLEAAEIYDTFSLKKKAVMDEIRAEQSRLGELSEKLAAQERGIEDRLSLVEQKLQELGRVTSKASALRRDLKGMLVSSSRQGQRTQRRERDKSRQTNEAMEKALVFYAKLALIPMLLVILAAWNFS